MRNLLSFFLLSGTLTISAQSDTPCGGSGAPTIPVNSTCVNSLVSITFADSYQSDPANFGPVSCGISGEDVWYSFVAPASGTVESLPQQARSQMV